MADWAGGRKPDSSNPVLVGVSVIEYSIIAVTGFVWEILREDRDPRLNTLISDPGLPLDAPGTCVSFSFKVIAHVGRFDGALHHRDRGRRR